MAPGMRQEVSRQTQAHYRRIGRMPRDWGEALDRRGAPLFVMRWVAWAGDEEEGERRLQEAIGLWDRRGRRPRWDRLTCGEGRRRRGAGGEGEREEERGVREGCARAGDGAGER